VVACRGGDDMTILARRILLVVLGLTVTIAPAAIVNAEPYRRSLYRHWIDADGDCQNTRQEVLIAESLDPPTLDARGCAVVAGRWYDPYTGAYFTDPGKLDIDHMIPLKEVHLSGGEQWDAARRKAYANDLDDARTLIAVSAAANRSKGAQDPARWVPTNLDYHCTYVAEWVAVKTQWGLTMDARESARIAEVQQSCPAALTGG